MEDDEYRGWKIQKGTNVIEKIEYECLCCDNIIDMLILYNYRVMLKDEYV